MDQGTDAEFVADAADGLTAAITEVTGNIQKFLLKIPDARKEMNEITLELGSLKRTLEVLVKDLRSPGAKSPSSLLEKLYECEDVLLKVCDTIEKFGKTGLSARMKYAWAGREAMNTCKSNLSAHRVALDLATDVRKLSSKQDKFIEPRTSREKLRNYRIAMGQDPNMDEDAERILEEISALQARLPSAARARLRGVPAAGDSNFALRRYLEELTEYADTVVDDEETVVGDGEKSDLKGTENSSLQKMKDLGIDAGKQKSTPSSDTSGTFSGDNSPYEPPSYTDAVPICPVSRSQRPVIAIGSRARESPPAYSESPGASQPTLTHPQSAPLPPLTKYPAPAHNTSTTVALKVPNGPANITWDTDIPRSYSKAGLETRSHRAWRERVTRAMACIPDAEVGPKNGSTYEQDADYTFEDYESSRDIVPIFRCAPTNADDSAALFIKWLRAFSMTGDFVNHCVCFGPPFRETKLWTVPLMVAVEMQDYEWVTSLFDAGAIPPGPYNGYDQVGRVKKRFYLVLAAEWNLEMLKHLTEELYARDVGEEAEGIRSSALTQIIQLSSLGGYGTQERPHSIPERELPKLAQFAAKLLLNVSNGPSLSVSKLNMSLRAAIRSEDKPMVQLMLDHDADVNYLTDYGWGTPMHEVVVSSSWGMLKFLVERGGDLEIEAQLSRKFHGEYWVEERPWTPIEFAARMRKLDKLNEVLGMQYKV